MAKDEFIKTKIMEHKTSIISNVDRPFFFNKGLFIFAKEVERETRHRAAEILNRAAQEIENL